MDYGFVTDSYGRKVNFRHTIIVFTSNVGAELYAKNNMGFASKKQKDACKHELRKKLDERFSPEFLNRIDLALPFSPIPQDHAKEIINSKLNEMTAKLAKKKIQFCYSDEVVQYLQEAANVSEFGARNIGRAINLEIGCKIAEIANKASNSLNSHAKNNNSKSNKNLPISITCSVLNKALQILESNN